jgi:uncharacterized membrane protein
VTPINFFYILIAEGCAIAGQLFFKRAMSDESDQRRAIFVQMLTIGIALKAVEFFLRLGLLARFDLSFLYPFEGLNNVVLVAASWFFLKERTTPQLWLGVGFITAGVALVSTS